MIFRCLGPIPSFLSTRQFKPNSAVQHDYGYINVHCYKLLPPAAPLPDVSPKLLLCLFFIFAAHFYFLSTFSPPFRSASSHRERCRKLFFAAGFFCSRFVRFPAFLSSLETTLVHPPSTPNITRLPHTFSERTNPFSEAGSFDAFSSFFFWTELKSVRKL